MRMCVLLAAVASALVMTTVSLGANGPRVDMPFAMTVRILNEQAGQYQVEVVNTNPTRFVSSFNWTPPAGMEIVSIQSARGAKCNLSTDGLIICKGQAAPPKSAEGVGESVTVNFTASGRQPTYANGYWIHYGVLGSAQVSMSKFTDLPLCKKGQKNTRAHPCASI
jgi:hypothetical protein